VQVLDCMRVGLHFPPVSRLPFNSKHTPCCSFKISLSPEQLSYRFSRDTDFRRYFVFNVFLLPFCMSVIYTSFTTLLKVSKSGLHVGGLDMPSDKITQNMLRDIKDPKHAVRYLLPPVAVSTTIVYGPGPHISTSTFICKNFSWFNVLMMTNSSVCVFVRVSEYLVSIISTNE